jgi:serine/threonine-protein kinase
VKLEANEYLWWGNLGDAYRWAPGQSSKAKPAYENAIRLARESLSAHPDDLDLRSSLALYLIKSGDKNAALTEINEVDRATKKPASVLFKSAVVYELSGERDEALHRLTAALKTGYALKEVQNEPELLALRTDPRYQSILAGLQHK